MSETTNFKNTVGALFDGMDGFVSTKTVVGEAIDAGGVTILPLIDVSFGLGAGSSDADKKEKGMGGIGGKMSASAVLVIKDGNVRLVNIKNQDTITKILDMVPGLVDKFTEKKESKITEDDVSEIIDEAKKQKKEGQ